MSLRNVIRKASKFFLIASVGTVLVFAGQVGQYMVSTKDARMHTIALWNEQNPNNTAISQQFINNCLTPKKLEEGELKEQLSRETKAISVYDCGNNLGAESLVTAIRKSDDSMSSLAWPLSVFAD
ncbi:hypothetical protein FWP33_18735 [Vibrio parahaemolyticus]|jgi:hypothetical protein|uniref:Uncharacterized protein n=1 Tax=Vibrio jasicida TaxID=766224 RepID=A0AAU9QVC5_9VIBR|nr:hypothetical protein [Vibrio parahaemolyticus]EJC7176212.1 hypothetical protein [Vibrio parahaemolyticus]EJG0009946.1 hypothetical protein [Vibrio parahaemolyticus]CAH1598972.1 conserved hypothetical protein [Vibrio jasicida]CAH1601388.1 conserved hypothetical protein [Vibrio jasicida]